MTTTAPAPTLPDLTKLTGCLFAPANVSPRNLFAEDPAGELLHIDEVEKGRKDLICPDCRTTLYARKNKVTPHFYHASGKDCVTAGETALHQLAKTIIAEGGQLRLPAVTVPGQRGPLQLQAEERVTFDRVEVEPWQPPFRPDLLGHNARGRNGMIVEPRLTIEIFVTHAVEDEKREELRKRGVSLLEIDLSKVRRRLGLAELREQILTLAKRDWLVHRTIEQIRRQEAARQQAEEERREEQRRKRTQFLDQIRAVQDRARSEPPRPSRPAERAEAEAERHRWLALGAPDPISLKADDGVFTVEPLLWRTAVLTDLAPWNNPAPGAPGIRRPWMVTFDLTQLSSSGLIKKPFLPEAIPVPVEGDPPTFTLLERLQGLRRAFVQATLETAGLPIRPNSWVRDAEAQLAQSWQHLKTVRGPLIRAMEFFEDFGFELLATDGSGQPGTPEAPRRPRTAADVDALLATGWARRQAGAVRVLSNLMADYRALQTLADIQALTDALVQHGLAVAAASPADPSGTFEALKRILIDRAPRRLRSARGVTITTPARQSS